MIRKCELCPEAYCISDGDGRLITVNGRTTFTGVSIDKCDTREAFLMTERQDLLELEDGHGLTSTILLGC